MRVDSSRILCVLFVVGALAMSRVGYTQCANNVSVGDQSTCFGNSTLINATTDATFNLALGYAALETNATGSFNTAVGQIALVSNSTGSNNTAVGMLALAANTTGSFNVAVGATAIRNAESASGNTAIGYQAMEEMSVGAYNVAAGINALYNDSVGGYNVGLGAYTLYSNISGFQNTAVGYFSLANQTSGRYNVVVGQEAGNAYTGSESNNILLASSGVLGDNGVLRLGSPGSQTKAFVAGIYGVTSSSGVPVYVNSSGQLGTATSSRRFKEDISAMGTASDELLQLRPVTFHYQAQYDDGQRILQYGLIAEEVEKVDPGLVQYDNDGQPMTVRYNFVNAMLLAEVQKQHATIATLEQTLAALTERLAKLEAASASRP